MFQSLVFNLMNFMNKTITILIALALLPGIVFCQQSIEWGTYFGGEEGDGAVSFAPTNAGGFYLIGNTGSATNVATVGAFDTDFGSGFTEGYLAKFGSGGNLEWSTYIGGDGFEEIVSIHVDSFGNAIVAGSTLEEFDVATSGALQENYSGGVDVFIMCFNPDGERIWGTYLGGTGDDFLGDFYIGVDNNIIVAGQTSSEGMGLGSVYQSEIFNTTERDGFIAKLNATTLEWFTYYGGSEDDGVGIIDVNDADEIMVVGKSFSETNMTTLGAYKEVKTDNGEVVVAKFDSTGNIIWGTYWGGFSMNIVRGAFDSNGNIVFCGRAIQDEGIATAGAHNEIFSGEELGYVAKFSDAGFPLWCTYTGGVNGDYDYIISMDVDADNNIYVGGRTNYLEDIGTPNTIVPSVVDSDVYAYGWLTKFNPDGTRDWGTYLPCIENGGATTAILFQEGSILLAVNTSCQNEIVLTDGLDTNYGGGVDTYIFKLDIGVSVEENTMESFSIFPNPTNHSGLIVISDNENCSAYIIRDSIGRTLVSEKLRGDARQIHLDTSSLNSGVFLLSIYFDEQCVTRKFVIE